MEGLDAQSLEPVGPATVASSAFLGLAKCVAGGLIRGAPRLKNKLKREHYS